MSRRIAAVLVVPHGTHRPEPLAHAVAASHPTWEVGAVWCGDPQMRPPLHDLAWFDRDPSGAADEVGLVAGDASVGEWRRSVDVVTRLRAEGFDQIVLLWVGATAVLGAVDALIADPDRPMTLVARSIKGLADDGLWPSEIELGEAGLYSTTVAVFGSESRPVLEWLASNLTGRAGVGHLLPRAAQLFGASVCVEESIGVGPWRWNGTAPALLDVAGYDTSSPWTLDQRATRPMRIELLGQPQRQQALSAAAPQLAGERTELRLPGGLVVDSVVRQVVAESAEVPPAPWSSAAQFRSWLAPRYWRTLHGQRRDLSAAFPVPDGRSAADFQRWCRSAFTCDEVPLLVAAPEQQRSHLVVAEDLRSDGVNLVGYLTRASGLGDVARRVLDAIRQAQLPHTTVATERTASPIDEAMDVDNRVEFTNSLCVVTADQFPFLAADFDQLFAATRRMIGYWFWELEHVPLQMRQSIAFVDEIWAGSRFVTDAFAAVSPVPVRHVPIPVAEPRSSGRSRQAFPLLADIGDRPMFVTVLDHLSVTERKNPVGVIEAFRQAFAPGEGPVLVVKTMNGRQRWPNHQRVLAAADGRADIRVWDEALDRADQMALIAAADCMVSLHRSEGLGLHLAEAMWLGTPTIATRYSGNLDFMDDHNSLLIDAAMVNVVNGQGVYPTTAKWAAPDREQAAAAMRRIVGDTKVAAKLSAAGRQTMEQQPSLAETGRLISQLLLREE
jgi:glycosyltransferase involved in cell wall biosynthesis